MKITMKGETVSVVLNGKTVLDKSKMPGVGNKGPIVLQHHGGYNEKTKSWSSSRPLFNFGTCISKNYNRTIMRLLLTLFFVTGFAKAKPEHWNQFRGPNGTGMPAMPTCPLNFPKRKT